MIYECSVLFLTKNIRTAIPQIQVALNGARVLVIRALVIIVYAMVHG